MMVQADIRFIFNMTQPASPRRRHRALLIANIGFAHQTWSKILQVKNSDIKNDIETPSLYIKMTIRHKLRQNANIP